MIDADFIQKIEELVKATKPEIIKIADKNYCDKELKIILPPTPPVLLLHTISGVVDYIKANLDSEKRHVISIKNFDRVDVWGDLDPAYAMRKGYLTSHMEDFTFKFNTYYAHEDFVIALQSQFLHDDSYAKFMEKIGNIQAEATVKTSDNGFSQTTTIKDGIVTVAEVELPNPVTLAPRRTFSEIKQPSSQFVFRMRRQNGVELALFEMSGGFWRVECIHAIRDYFKEQLKETECVIIA